MVTYRIKSPVATMF